MPVKRKTLEKGRKAKSLATKPLEGSAAFKEVDSASTGLDSKLLQDYVKEMRQVVRKGIISGCVSIAYHKDQVVLADAVGMADVERGTPFSFDTYCRMYCATKPFIAIAVFRFAEDGKLDLNDRLDKYIPEFGKVLVQPEGADAPVETKRPILLKHLLCHCSGIAYAPDVGETVEDESSRAYLQLQQDVQQKRIKTLAEFARGIARVPLSDHPGNSYWYGFSFDVLGRVLEVVGKKRLDKVLAETVFRPLGMKHTKWAVRRDELPKLAACYAHKPTWKKLYGHVKGRTPSAVRPSLVRIDGNKARDSHWLKGKECRVQSGGGFMGYLYGGLVSTVADTARFVRMLMHKGKLDDGRRFLSPSSVTALEKNRMKEGVDPVNYLGNIGTYRKNGTEYGMGGAACTYWSIDRADETATIWFTQHVDMPEVADMKGINTKKADLWDVLHRAVVKGSKSSNAHRSAKRARSE
ncbi:unnamed protein product [Symbiodinium natans]|uniref:Beta-lactamase-related domain-containing protein n=1 Tax=Symbiodinium natans TaxID=878477 RepID=A0A812J707_9DINO|nr:unnamed protein product [Symbiodinium natans]